MKKIILVTGASSGIGKATAERLLAEGHKVYGAARRLEKLNYLEEKGGKALEMDVTNPEQVKEGIELITDVEGQIDVLINNAGYAVYGAVEDVDLDDARRQFEVNIFGLAQVTKEVIPHMRKRKKGKIINISSVGGKIYTPLGAWYHATKHALEGWSDCLRLELKPFNIDVVIIEPGIIGTEFADVLYDPMMERAKGSPYEDISNKIGNSARERYADPKESSSPSVIANLISEAINSDNPRTRYSGGKLAKFILSMRKLLSDKMFDKLIMSQVK